MKAWKLPNPTPARLFGVVKMCLNADRFSAYSSQSEDSVKEAFHHHCTSLSPFEAGREKRDVTGKRGGRGREGRIKQLTGCALN